MSEQTFAKERPYWHVDAKWITGLVLVVVLSITFLIFNLVQITNQENGIDFLTILLASMFSQQAGGLDEEADIEIALEKMAADPDGIWQPIENLNITIQEDEIEGLTPREIRLLFFRKWAEPLYQDGIEGLADLADDPDMKASILDGGGLLNVITEANHSKLKTLLTGLVILCAVLLAFLVFFSYRFGRLASPGCVIFAAALPGFILLPLSAGLGSTSTGEIPAEGSQGMLATYAQIAGDSLPGIIEIITRNYLIFLGVGFLLMLVGILGGIFIREKKT